MRRFTFKKINRLQHKREFDAVFRRPRKIKSDFLTLLTKPNDLSTPRLGVIVPKRLIKQAVDRNRIKRLFREAFRQYKDEFENMDLIITINRTIGVKEEMTLDHVLTLFQAMTIKHNSI